MRARIDARLAPVINRLLRERIWRIADFPGLRPRRGYLIDEEFSNLCYRSFGNRYFSPHPFCLLLRRAAVGGWLSGP
jgi:hypothetical protein